MKKRGNHKKYRKIYEQCFGDIPIDAEGRTYDIHHLDGNSENNSPDNLIAVTIREHYDIHYSQGDYTACLMISKRMAISAREKSELARKEALKRVKNGTHHFLGGKIQTDLNARRIDVGTHNFLGGEIQKETQRKLVTNGTHHFLDSESQRAKNIKRINDGSHHLLGKNHHNFDHTIYKFRNKRTNEILELTRSEFIVRFNASASSLWALINGRYKSVLGWEIIT